jgi:hypothetical protein
MKKPPSKPKLPRGRKGKTQPGKGDQPTADEFEREGMGIAPKE